VTNSTVDGILSAFFAILIVIVILDAARICVKALRSREPLPSTEVPAAESRLRAPSGLFTREREFEWAER
jgi:carbon starvation protein